MSDTPAVRVAIHQPNYLPWVGFFHKLAWSDIFVFLDHVPFTKNSYQNRVRISGHGEPMWLTQPVATKGKFGAPTDQILFATTSWTDHHLKSLHSRYGRYPHFNGVRDLLEPIYARASDHLADTNRMFIEAVASYLSFQPRFESSRALDPAGTSTGLLVDLCRKLHATEYLAGAGSQKYINHGLFQNENIPVATSTFEPRAYFQMMKEFQPGLSIVDLLFALGTNARGHVLGADF